MSDSKNTVRHYGQRTIGQRLLSVVGFGEMEHLHAAERAERIGEGISRYYPRGLDPDRAEPSFALVREPEVLGPAPAVSSVAPLFAVRPNGQRVAHVEIGKGTDLYGTGEIAGPLRRNGKRTQAWTSDTPSYDESDDALYQAHPWVLGVREDGSAFGVLADTTWRCEIDLSDGITFRGSGPEFPVIVIDRKTPEDVLRGLAELTGTMPMPPKWAIGYHQCRFSYFPDARVREVADEFREREIPCDVIWMDIDYMEKYRIFTFDPEHFPDPKGTNDYLHGKGFHSVWMIDPGPAADDGYDIYEQGKERDVFVRDQHGHVFTDKVWPERVVWPDFTRPDVSEWWAGLYKDFMATGVDGVWNDMNEPAIIDGAMPESCRHGGGEWKDLTIPGDMHARYHNVYGFLMVRASQEGIKRANPEKRPFLLTRSNYIGGQRYAATWTGDNTAKWRDVNWSITMVLNLGLSGQPFSGPDLGGFCEDGTAEMFAQWFGFGALLPFARGHAANDVRDKEPWAYDQATEDTCRRAIRTRYRLLPYYYTLFREAHVSGVPVARPVFFADTNDARLRTEQHSFLLGTDVLVCAKDTPGMDHKHELPAGIWRRFEPVDREGDERLADLYIRGGSIVPMGPVMNYVDEKPTDPLTLAVCLGEDGRAEGLLYDDAGEGHGYAEGDFYVVRYHAARQGDDVVVHAERLDGNRAEPDRKIVVEVYTAEGVRTGGGRTGEQIRVAL